MPTLWDGTGNAKDPPAWREADRVVFSDAEGGRAYEALDAVRLIFEEDGNLDRAISTKIITVHKLKQSVQHLVRCLCWADWWNCICFVSENWQGFLVLKLTTSYRALVWQSKKPRLCYIQEVCFSDHGYVKGLYNPNHVAWENVVEALVKERKDAMKVRRNRALTFALIITL